MRFFPFHLKLVKIPEEQRRQLTEQGLTVLAYFSVSFCRKQESFKTSTDRMKGFHGLNKNHQLKALHDYSEACLHLLVECAMSGLTCETSDKKILKKRLLLTSYVTDISDTEDLLSMKRESQTDFPCHRCFVGKLQMSQITCSSRISKAETKILLNEYSLTAIRDNLSNVSTRSVRLVMPLL